MEDRPTATAQGVRTYLLENEMRLDRTHTLTRDVHRCRQLKGETNQFIRREENELFMDFYLLMLTYKSASSKMFKRKIFIRFNSIV